MSVYTVHEPPLRTADSRPDPERFVFVRDGFYFWAFLFGPLWMLWRRLWLVLAAYLAILLAIQGTAMIAGTSFLAPMAIAVLMSLLVGLEAGSLRRFTLWRRGFRNVGVVSGEDSEDAERRFFDTWLRGAPSKSEVVPPAPPLPLVQPPPLPRAPQSPDVIGLFPQPGANR
jgi:Protein of unknown function (DUF2628)